MKKIQFVAVAIALATSAAPAMAQQSISGNWRTEDGSALVRIGQCGATTCGRITQILRSERGPNPLDANNPDASLRSRPIRGLSILTGFTADGDLWRGQIYDPKAGKTYRSVLQRQGADRLSVKGCIAMFCREQIWTRAD